MGRLFMWVALAGAVLAPMAADLQACGDKLLVLGRGIRFQSRHTPRAAAVLLYLPPVATGQALTDPNLESALREAGHTVHAVTASDELREALRSGSYDVVLTNVTDASDLERARRDVPGTAVVLPAVYLMMPSGHRPTKQQAKADEARAGKDFGVVVQVPSRPGYYCAAVDKAMAMKLKRDDSTRKP
jgi:hypothetical protein